MSNTGRPITLVTGGSRGIGAATVLRLAQAGHDVAVGYLEDEESARGVASAATAHGVRALPVRGQVADPDDVDRMFATVAAELGPVTGLVNNAGITAHLGNLADTPVAVIRQVVEVNLLGALFCARRAAATMSTDRGGGGGAIVNVSSVAAATGSPGDYVHYAAAKAGVEALTVGLATELAGQGVRVNTVAPGIVRTDIHAGAGDPGRPDRLSSRIPLGRPGEPDEVAPAIVWLLGPEAGYVTGATIRVSGGL